jgi:hypothetical protein
MVPQRNAELIALTGQPVSYCLKAEIKLCTTQFSEASGNTSGHAMDNLYSFVYRGLLSEKSLDKAGRQRRKHFGLLTRLNSARPFHLICWITIVLSIL